LASPPRTGARIAGIGAARPTTTVSATDLTAPFDKTAEWLRARSGIESVQRLSDDESLLELAVRASCAALADAGLAAEQVEIVIVASCSGEPGPGRPLADRLAGAIAPDSAAFDLNAACAGFCYALSSAESLVSSGSAHIVLVVGAEQMGRLIDERDLATSVLFGDGAGAVVVTSCPVEDHAFARAAWSSDGTQAQMLHVPEGEKHLRMNGRSVFRWAVSEVPAVLRQAIHRAGIEPNQIEVFVPHQANLRIIDSIRRDVGLEHAITATEVTKSGNTSAASIPMALAGLREGGARLTGKLALLAGFGAGLSIAAQVVRLP